MSGDQRLVVTYKVGVDFADDGDTLVFDQGSTDANGGAGQFFLKNTNSLDEEELDFAAVDSSEPIGETVTFTATIYPTDPTTNDISPWTVTHDRGGELI
jgi:hypothetical protein